MSISFNAYTNERFSKGRYRWHYSLTYMYCVALHKWRLYTERKALNARLIVAVWIWRFYRIRAECSDQCSVCIGLYNLVYNSTFGRNWSHVGRLINDLSILKSVNIIYWLHVAGLHDTGFFVAYCLKFRGRDRARLFNNSYFLSLRWIFISEIVHGLYNIYLIRKSNEF